MPDADGTKAVRVSDNIPATVLSEDYGQHLQTRITIFKGKYLKKWEKQKCGSCILPFV